MRPPSSEWTPEERLSVIRVIADKISTHLTGHEVLQSDAEEAHALSTKIFNITSCGVMELELNRNHYLKGLNFDFSKVGELPVHITDGTGISKMSGAAFCRPLSPTERLLVSVELPSCRTCGAELQLNGGALKCPRCGRSGRA